MPVHVTFMKPDGVNSSVALNVGICRAYEALTVPATTTAAAQDGEVALIVNTEDSAVKMARGSTPDASATAATTATDAVFVVGAGVTMTAQMRNGQKLAAAAE